MTRRIVFAFMEFLNSLKQQGALTEETRESLEVAIQCLGAAFQLDTSNTEQQNQYSLR